MPRFAQLDGMLVTATLEATAAPTLLPAGRTFVELTEQSEVQGGETYDPKTGTFAAPQISAKLATLPRQVEAGNLKAAGRRGMTKRG